MLDAWNGHCYYAKDIINNPSDPDYTRFIENIQNAGSIYEIDLDDPLSFLHSVEWIRAARSGQKKWKIARLSSYDENAEKPAAFFPYMEFESVRMKYKDYPVNFSYLTSEEKITLLKAAQIRNNKSYQPAVLSLLCWMARDPMYVDKIIQMLRNKTSRLELKFHFDGAEMAVLVDLECIKRFDFSFACFQKKDLSGIDFSNANFKGTILRDTIFEKADLTNANFKPKVWKSLDLRDEQLVAIYLQKYQEKGREYVLSAFKKDMNLKGEDAEEIVALIDREIKSINRKEKWEKIIIIKDEMKALFKNCNKQEIKIDLTSLKERYIKLTDEKRFDETLRKYLDINFCEKIDQVIEQYAAEIAFPSNLYLPQKRIQILNIIKGLEKIKTDLMRSDFEGTIEQSLNRNIAKDIIPMLNQKADNTFNALIDLEQSFLL